MMLLFAACRKPGEHVGLGDPTSEANQCCSATGPVCCMLHASPQTRRLVGLAARKGELTIPVSCWKMKRDTHSCQREEETLPASCCSHLSVFWGVISALWHPSLYCFSVMHKTLSERFWENSSPCLGAKIVLGKTKAAWENAEGGLFWDAASFFFHWWLNYCCDQSFLQQSNNQSFAVFV